MTAIKSVLLFLALPAVAFALGMSDGKISGDDWAGLAAAFSGSAAMTAKRHDLLAAATTPKEDIDVAELHAHIAYLEAENRTLRAKLNDGRYLLRRGLALLSSHRNLTIGLAGAATASLLVATGQPARIVAAWQELAEFPGPTTVHAYGTTIHSRPAVVDERTEAISPGPAGSHPPTIMEVTSGRDSIDKGGEADAPSAAAIQRRRRRMVGRPPVDRPNARSSEGAAQGRQ